MNIVVYDKRRSDKHKLFDRRSYRWQPRTASLMMKRMMAHGTFCPVVLGWDLGRWDGSYRCEAIYEVLRRDAEGRITGVNLLALSAVRISTILGGEPPAPAPGMVELDWALGWHNRCGSEEK